MIESKYFLEHRSSINDVIIIGRSDALITKKSFIKKSMITMYICSMRQNNNSIVIPLTIFVNPKPNSEFSQNNQVLDRAAYVLFRPPENMMRIAPLF